LLHEVGLGSPELKLLASDRGILVNSISDLIASARTVHDRYCAGRMERETVREWISRLGTYPAPHGDRVCEAADWFRANRTEPVSADVWRGDVERLRAICDG
jgi:hypothetical protein